MSTAGQGQTPVRREGGSRRREALGLGRFAWAAGEYPTDCHRRWSTIMVLRRGIARRRHAMNAFTGSVYGFSFCTDF